MKDSDLAICFNLRMAGPLASKVFARQARFVKQLEERGGWKYRHVLILSGTDTQLAIELKNELLESAFSDGFVEIITSPSSGLRACFENILSFLDERSTLRGIFHFWADSAFLNTSVNCEILDLYREYGIDYVFAEGYPWGVSGEILRGEAVGQLVNSASEDGLRRDAVFECIRPVINNFDLETAVAPRDLRMLRLRLFYDNRRNAQICEFLEPRLHMGTSREEFCEIVAADESGYRSLPAYFELQINASSPQYCTYSPYPLLNPGFLNSKDYMSLEVFASVLDKIKNFVEDPVVNLFEWGECALHPEFPEILRLVSERGDIRFLLETSGLGWSGEAKAVVETHDFANLEVILCLDAVDPQLYRQLRGNGFEEAMVFADWGASTLGDKFYVQAVRMVDNEAHLLHFYRYWKEKNVKFIIQKYNWYGGLLPQRRVADLAPLKRHACWHVKRDLIIHLGGNCYNCSTHSVRPNQGYSMGNIYTDDLPKIWENGQELYYSQLKGEMSEICKSCDEWYTFNF